ncbi:MULTISPECIES: hypothetical protein [unclassified Microbacterium]|uniref:hypothetical protein n=1 Tax=unclassified Microbacterium TaxID=2609290 RepID=UPI00214AFD9F|nr:MULTISPECIES: hypothetical protein [unclassified Microbacterium]MCR2809087.1 hypothetical protein [Microbacterium sp. zg.B185]WIM20242.1 hypothetical protein QNO12_05410 [Microbacterium sp. zg-B185]
MSDRDETTPARDRLPPLEQRDEERDLDEQHHPDAGASAVRSNASPDTAAEPEKPRRHGVDTLPPTGR